MSTMPNQYDSDGDLRPLKHNLVETPTPYGFHLRVKRDAQFLGAASEREDTDLIMMADQESVPFSGETQPQVQPKTQSSITDNSQNVQQLHALQDTLLDEATPRAKYWGRTRTRH